MICWRGDLKVTKSVVMRLELKPSWVHCWVWTRTFWFEMQELDPCYAFPKFWCCFQVIWSFRFGSMYKFYWKHQVKLHSSPWFSAVFFVAKSQRDYFFQFYQKCKFCVFKGRLRQASNCCKRILEGAKLPSVL